MPTIYIDPRSPEKARRIRAKTLKEEARYHLEQGDMIAAAWAAQAAAYLDARREEAAA